jgi:hypothetical protein
MKFPVTRDELRSYNALKEREETLLANTLEHFCKEFERSMPTNVGTKQFVWRNLHNLKHHSVDPRFPKDEILCKFIEKIKETFLECEVIVDPLQTYIIVAWS